MWKNFPNKHNNRVARPTDFWVALINFAVPNTTLIKGGGYSGAAIFPGSTPYPPFTTHRDLRLPVRDPHDI